MNMIYSKFRAQYFFSNNNINYILKNTFEIGEEN